MLVALSHKEHKSQLSQNNKKDVSFLKLKMSPEKEFLEQIFLSQERTRMARYSITRGYIADKQQKLAQGIRVQESRC